MLEKVIANREEKALKDLKIVELGWAVTVPTVGKHFAEHGATVIKVESIHRLDPTRTFVPMLGNVSGIERSLTFLIWNDNKYSIAVNLKHPKGVEVVKRLIGWSDVVMENFKPQVMERLGLGYEDLKKINPNLIMLRASLFGQEGPLAMRTALGTVLPGLAGLAYHVGWPDRGPVPFSVAITDLIACFYCELCILASLDYRRRTGKGQCIDLSQHEAGVTFLTPDILDYIVNDRVKSRMGNRSPSAAPHGIYRCKGDDRWCAITIFSDEEWVRFCNIIGKPELATDPKFTTLKDRKKNEDELDRLIEEWTVNYTAEEVMRRMQLAGISAGVVKNARDLHEDAQLAHRHHYQFLDRSEVGVTAYDSPSFKLSRTPAQLTMPAPCLGEHTEYVCREILGMSDEEFVALYQEGVFE